ncbi:MAG: TerB family tellurite resistance protein [Cytophagaceae bacterium]|jgi:DnaJ like chaperone protein|nr:TerB family tellurite resistance protein [Cytophagaceae bacterium]
MKFWKTLLGAGLGWWMFGAVGGLIGLVVGSLIGNELDSKASTNENRVSHDGFVVSLLILLAAVMKADGKVLKCELDYVKKYLWELLGEKKSAQALIMLRDILKKNIPLHDVCHQIRVNVDYSARVQLLHILFGVGKSDGALIQSEINVIQTISNYLGISASDYHSVFNMFYDNIEAAYKILEIDKTASDEEIKKAYRKMAIRFHPDKVSHLGEEFQNAAGEKFRKVNEAYEKIKKDRGMK